MRYGWLVIMLMMGLAVSAQDSRLAQQYFQNGEYEKAAEMYEGLYKKNGNNDFFFDRYFQCLLAMESYSEAESVLQRQIRKDETNVKLYVSFGTLLERLNRYDEAEEQYQLAIDRLSADQYSVTRLANAFIGKTKYNYAIATYEKGAQLMRNDRIFSQNLGDLYRRMG
ncbi:MAG: CDC27 family protein, partial [Bacteroidota bacterium]